MKAWGSIVRDWLGAGLLTGALLISLAGCVPSFTFGTPPRTDQLRQLRRGASTSSEVRSLLGEPRGKGMAMLPIDPKQRVTWSYLYLDSSIQTEGETRGDMRSLILFVFFDQDRYAGYMWFSSVPD